MLQADATPKPSKGYNQLYCYYYVQFAIIDTFIRQYDILGDVLMGTLLNELEWCIRQQGKLVSLINIMEYNMHPK